MNWPLISLVFPLVSWSLLHIVFRLNLTLLWRLLGLVFIGLTFDWIGVHFDLLHLNSPPEVWLPIWLVSLWFLFVSSMPLLEGLLRQKYFLASLLGAVFGPLSYRAGDYFGLLTVNGTAALLIYALFWALYIPAGIYWLKRKDLNENQ